MCSFIATYVKVGKVLLLATITIAMCIHHNVITLTSYIAMCTCSYIELLIYNINVDEP